MIQIQNEIDIAGKTIKDTGRANDLFSLIFDDGTFCILQATYYDGPLVLFSGDNLNLNPLPVYMKQELFNLGLITKAELDEAVVKNRSAIEAKEYQMYLRLKKQFEGK